VLAGAFLVVVGLHDALLSQRAPERLLGAVLLILGVAILGSFSRNSLRFLGYLAACTAATTLVAIQVSYRNDVRTWLWAGFAVVFGFAATRAFLIYLKASRRGVSRETVGIAVALFTAVIAPVLSVVGGAFRPVTTAQQPSVTAQAVVLKGDRAGMGLVKSTFTIQNIGNRRLMIIGSVYDVFGYKMDSRDLKTMPNWQYADETARYGWSGFYESPSYSHAIEFGFDVLAPGNYIEPGQSISETYLTPFKTSDLNVVGADVSVATAFGDRLQLGNQIENAAGQPLVIGDSVESAWNVEPTSWLAAIVRGRATMRIGYEIQPMSDAERMPGNPIDAKIPFGMIGTYEIGYDVQKVSRELEYERLGSFYGTGWSSGTVIASTTGN
jgi:hypothetical protein